MILARTTSVVETWALAAEVAGLLQARDVLVLAGDLGSGKTAFAQGLARGLGVTEQVTSPTFVLARCYDGRLPMAHLDVYRLDRLTELVDIGIAEMVDGDGITVVEWGDVVIPALPPDFLEVRLEAADLDLADGRTLTLRAVGPSWPGRLEALRRVVSPWAMESGEL